MGSNPEAGELVRTYSLGLENSLSVEVPVNDVRRIFVDDERRRRNREEENARWREYYEPWKPVNENVDPTTKVLREQAVFLSHAWKVFREKIPQSEQDEFEGQVPSVDGLISMVDTVARDWQNKRMKSKSGKYMKYFTSFCETLDAHSCMLEVLPDGNEYVSLFTGTLKSIISACSNYEKIASGLGKALSKISVHVVACQKEVRLHQTKAMQEKISLLYAHVFLFLDDTIMWYLKKPRLKLRDALRENFYDHFEEMIVNIQDLSRDVWREASVTTMAETRQIRLTTEETLDSLTSGQVDSRLSLNGISREQAEIKYQLEQLRIEVQRETEERRQLDLNGQQWIELFRNNLLSQIASGVRQELLGVAQKALDERSLKYENTTIERACSPIGYIKNLEGGSTAMHSYERDTVAFDSNHLLNFFSPANVQPPYPPTSIFLETIASSRLKEWTTERSINLLSIAGRRPKGMEDAAMTGLASICVDFAVKAKLPVISYFISIPHPGELNDSSQTKEIQAMISLTYALTRQLIEQLPAQFSSSFDFSQARLARLEGTLKSWSDAVELLRDLMEIVPKPLFCIIDGFQFLDDSSTDKLLDDLVKVFKMMTKAAMPATESLKILITTTGRSRSLTRNLNPKELILADRDGAVDGPARRGGNTRLIL